MLGKHNLNDNDQHTRSLSRGISDMKVSLPHQSKVQIWTTSSWTCYHPQDLMCSNCCLRFVCKQSVLQDPHPPYPDPQSIHLSLKEHTHTHMQQSQLLEPHLFTKLVVSRDKLNRIKHVIKMYKLYK